MCHAYPDRWELLVVVCAIHVDGFFLFFFFLMFIFERERQERERAGEGQRERETQNPKQAPGFELSAESPTLAATHKS